MLTDAPPRKNRAEFLESDRIKTLDLTLNGDLPGIAQRLESAMQADKIRDVRSACADCLLRRAIRAASRHYSTGCRSHDWAYQSECGDQRVTLRLYGRKM